VIWQRICAYGWWAALGLLICAASWLDARAADDEWPQYGHDGALTGRSGLKGDIRNPRVAWSCSVAGTAYTLELTPASGEHESILDSGVKLPQRSRATDWVSLFARWGLGPVKLDMDGSGRLRDAPECFHERWAKILPDVRGMQRVAWNNTWTLGKIARLQLFAYDQGHDKPRLVWQTDPPDGDVFSPLNVVYDIDGDGTQEVCVAAHYRVMIFEGTTGRKETELRYHSNRPYGWFGLADVDGDGQMELITLGDFQSHFDVLEFDRGKPEPQRLSVKWRRDIETAIENRTKWPQVGPRPVVNVTGDARPEIVVNMFNDAGDEQWHVQVIDACNGSILCDLPRRYVQGSADVDGNGREELFCAATQGVVIPSVGVIELCAIEDGKSRVIWSESGGQWVCADLPRLGGTWSTTAASGMRSVVVTNDGNGGGPSWLVRYKARIGTSAPGADRAGLCLASMRMDENGKVARQWVLAGIDGRVEVAAARTDPGHAAPRALMKTMLAADDKARWSGHGVEATVLNSERVGGPLAPPIVARLKKAAPPSALVEGPGGRVFAIDAPSSDQGRPAVLWQVPGRGMASGSRWAGLAAADLDGDGNCEVLVGDESSDGHAELVAYRHDRSVFWRTRFDGIPGAPPIWNVGGLTFWWPGHFRHPDKMDVFVSLRKSLMHSDVGVMVDGHTGRVLWRQEKAVAPGQFHWGYAGSVTGVADVNGDGLDELINVYPVCYWVADGRTGKLIEAMELSSRKHLPAWAAYGEPIVRDFAGGGTPEVLLDSPYILALLQRSGRSIWHGLPRADYPTGVERDNVGETTATRHCLIDFDGDGRFEIASGGYKDGVRAIDPSNGKVLWRLKAPDPTCEKVAAVNIDGQGGDELIYPAGDKLIAVTGDRTQGRILWTWQGPAALSMPAIADIDGDGKAEIVIRSADGTIHCLR
jgi:hypothetical protein